jgi:hypothetical protein
MLWSDMVGYVGVALVVGSYFLLQSGRVLSTSPRFALANAAGAALIIVSLVYDFNWPSFVIEIFWFAASVYGLVRNRPRTDRR